MYTNNEKGNALITVLLISLIFTMLGISIVGASIGGVKRVETRESDMDITYDSIKVIDKMTTELTKNLSTLSLDYSSFNSLLKGRLQDLLTTVPETETNKIECLNIIDESSNTATWVDPSKPCFNDLKKFTPYNIATDNDFTRVLEFVLVTKNPNKNEGKITRTIRKRIILSPLPSFLKYAVGSTSAEDNSGLFLNGSSNIVGNIYANQMAIDNLAHFQKRDASPSQVDTPLPSIIGDIYSSTANLIPLVGQKDKFYKGSVPELKHDSQFIDIDFTKTINDRTNQMLLVNGIPAIQDGIQTDFKDILANGIRKILNGPTDEKIIGNHIITSTDSPITVNKNIIVDGDLYIASYNDLTISGNLYVTGQVHIINFGGKLKIDKNIISGDSIDIQASKGISSEGLVINGDILTGHDLTIRPIDTAININKNIIANGSFKIEGDEYNSNKQEEFENDQVIFDSVVYAGGSATISNVNILGADNNEKQLILLANRDLMITRINEFNNFNPSGENGNSYLPPDNSLIKPLKAFFYTESNAELYGVGSLFYINGGLFAKERLEINAVRGEVDDINDLPSRLSQEDHLSRFIVNYNRDVLLQKIDALPIVKELQLFSDELIID